MTARMNRRLALAGLPALLAAPAVLRGAAAQTAPAAAASAAPQAPGFYRFKVGGFTVTTVHDGFFERPVAGFVRNAPLVEVQKVLAESFLPTDTLRIPFTVTFVETPAGLVVFDAGNGATAAGDTRGRMIANMAAAGLDPAKVTKVIQSHFHGDHVNGLLNAAGGAAFPNAEIIVPAVEWAWWSDTGNETRSPEGQRPNFANSARRFGPYQGKIRQAAEGAEVAPGIRGVPAYGHTPGHTCYHIADGGQEAMFIADLTNRPELLARRPDFHIVFDFDAALAEASRRRVYDRVAADRIRITGYHFPFPANGYMVKEGDGYRFVPADWSSAV
ncbi:MBL fold metallo-hydrolase [Dankookia sp. GCM10030260]|uniref:MBL fold metallo-hydrolase n=1 Tax=Dankookia sp. GCM10030260 TaxID=3273390 RepID=UPI003619D431